MRPKDSLDSDFNQNQHCTQLQSPIELSLQSRYVIRNFRIPPEVPQVFDRTAALVNKSWWLKGWIAKASGVWPRFLRSSLNLKEPRSLSSISWWAHRGTPRIWRARHGGFKVLDDRVVDVVQVTPSHLARSTIMDLSGTKIRKDRRRRGFSRPNWRANITKKSAGTGRFITSTVHGSHRRLLHSPFDEEKEIADSRCICQLGIALPPTRLLSSTSSRPVTAGSMVRLFIWRGMTGLADTSK